MKLTSKEIEEFDKLNDCDIEAWENGDVGKNPNYMKPISKEAKEEFLSAKKNMISPTSMRLPNELRINLRKLAESNGLSYQAYVRMILTQHVKNKLAS